MVRAYLQPSDEPFAEFSVCTEQITMVREDCTSVGCGRHR